MNVEISGIAEEVIKDIISSGDAATPEEAVDLLAYRTMQEKQLLPQANDSDVAAAIQEGVSSGEAGELTDEDWSDLHRRLDQHLEENKGQRSAG